MPNPSPFPSDRIPEAGDTRAAAAPLDPEVLRKIKLHLGSTSTGRSHFPNVDDWVGGLSLSCPAAPHYPISLFIDFPEQPPVHVFARLVTEFESRVLPTLPCLREYPFNNTRRPTFFKMACAVLGAMASPDAELAEWAASLWQSAILVHSASVEVDNSVARTVDWVLGWALLQAYGVSCATRDIWSKTNAWNGHADTAARRMLAAQSSRFLSLSSRPDLPASLLFRNCMAFFFIIDQIRSLTFQVPASFRVVDMPIRFSNGRTFPENYGQLFSPDCASFKGLTRDEVLLLGFGILADIISCQRDIGGLVDFDDPLTKHSVQTTQGAPNADGITQAQRQTKEALYMNPFLPHSPTARYIETLEALKRALNRWQSLLQRGDIESSPQARQSHLEGFELACFCRMLVSSKPHIMDLARKVGFAPSSGFTVPGTSEEIAFGEISSTTLSLAWETFDATEAVLERVSSDCATPIASIWRPIFCFFTALVVWSGTKSSLPRSLNHAMPPSRNLLKLFEAQLKQMDRPNARAMLSIVRLLRDHDLLTEPTRRSV